MLVPCPIRVRFEKDLIDDAWEEIRLIIRALALRHGEPFRQLDRRIDQLIDDTENDRLDWCDVVEWLPTVDGVVAGVLLVPPQLRSILADARRLEVI